MYKCFIIDDESHAIETLKRYALDSGLLEIAGACQNPVEAIKLINSRQDVDITFLDIDMPDMSGLEVADLIQQHTAIIFTTGHAGYAVQGFEKNISDFLLKPISFPRFLKSLHKVISLVERRNTELQKNSPYFFVNPGIKGKMLKINFNDVDFVEALNNYVVIHTPQTNHIIYLTMKEIELGLTPDFFIRIHKSYIVNINKITLLEGNKLMLEKVVLPIGSSFKDKLLQRINNDIIKTHRS